MAVDVHLQSIGLGFDGLLLTGGVKRSDGSVTKQKMVSETRLSRSRSGTTPEGGRSTDVTTRYLRQNLNHEIIAYLGGKLRQHNIKIIQGDIVDVEMTPYDLSKGRIVYRNK